MSALPWIKVTVDLPNHPKLLELQEQLGTADGLGIVIRLWCWVAKYFADGRVPARWTTAMLVEALRGVKSDVVENDDILEAMVLSGWLDSDGDVYVVHDWYTVQAAHTERAEKNRERQR